MTAPSRPAPPPPHPPRRAKEHTPPHPHTPPPVGGDPFTWGFTTLGVTGLVALGVDFHEAETALLLLAFLVFLPLFLWAFAAPSLARVWALLGGGAVLMGAAALGLQQVLLG